MAGIYLPGREMPRSCYFCDFIFRDTADKKVYCTESGCHKETWLDLSDTLANSRHEDCPLVFVPDHGRLGDLDELEKLFLNAGENHKGIGGLMTGMAALCVREMPTIIPASKEVRT